MISIFKLKSSNCLTWFLLISVIVFALFITTSVSIKCWLCNSRTDPKCGDPFVNDSIPLNDCSSYSKKPQTPELANLTATMCRKVRQKVDNEWRVIRSCAFLGKPGEGTGNENVCLYTKDSYNIFIETCTCNSKDGCNTSSALKASFILIIWTLIIHINWQSTY